MSSRALSLAAVVLVIGCMADGRAWAQATNLEAGKSPSQIFAQTCSACHKSPRGLLKSVAPGSLPNFLRQHYTTSSDMAGVLASYLISNGAADTRYGSAPLKGGKEANSSATQGGAPDQIDRSGRRQHPRSSQEGSGQEAEPRQTAKPEGETTTHAKRHGRPGETESAKPREEQTPPEATNERGPDGRKLSAKQKLSKRGKPAEEAGKGEAVKEGSAGPATEEKPKSETAKVDAGKDEGKPEGKSDSKSESAKPAEETKPDAAKTEPDKSESAKVGAPETPVLRADPVPPVTPAPTATEAPVAAKPAESPPATSNIEPEATNPPEPTPAVSAAPPLPPVPPAGPPAPPISQ